MALHHYLSWHSVVPAPRTILAGVRKLPPATVLTVEPDGRRREHRVLGPALRARPRSGRTGRREDWQDAMLEALRIAVDRRMVADVPVGVLLSGGLDSSLIVALLAQAGQRGLQTFSVGFPRRRRSRGRRVRLLRPGRASASAPTTTRSASTTIALLPALHEAVAAMSEPMVSHDCVAFYLLSEEVSRAREGRAVRAGRRRDPRRLLVVPAAAEADGDGLQTYAAEFFDRDHDALVALLGDGGRLDEDAEPARSPPSTSRARAPMAPSIGRCAWTAR